MISRLMQAIKNLFDARRTPFIAFFVLSLLVTLPLFLHRGSLFFLDWSPLPQAQLPKNFATSSSLFNTVYWFLNLFLPGGFLQKIFLTATFFIGGYGMYRLLRRGNFVRESWAAYFGGIFYMFNPFVYSRGLVGHWTIVMALAIYPWFFMALLRFFQKATWRTALYVALWWTITINVNLHLGLMLGIPILFFGLCALIKTIFSRINPFKLLGGLAAILVLFVIFNSYWMLPIFRGDSTVGDFVAGSVTDRHIFSFFTRADPQHGVLWNTAAMYGFWADEDQRYVPQKVLVPHWFYLFFIFFGLVVWGVITSIRRVATREKQEASNDWRIFATLVVTGMVAFFFAVGVSYLPFEGPVLWFYHTIPFFEGFREPQKFVALLVFVYAIFASIGVNDILGRVERLSDNKFYWVKLIVPGLFFLVPLAYSPGIFWGFNNQIKPAQYPPSWFAVNDLLNHDSDNFRTLFLPWHEYIKLSFAGTVVVNPAEQFFQKPTIAGDNMEFGPIYTQSTRPESKYIENEILANGDKFAVKDQTSSSGDAGGIKPGLSLGDKLDALNIKYVVVAQESDFFNYDFVSESPDMVLIYDSQNLKVYKNLKWQQN